MSITLDAYVTGSVFGDLERSTHHYATISSFLVYTGEKSKAMQEVSQAQRYIHLFKFKDENQYVRLIYTTFSPPWPVSPNERRERDHISPHSTGLLLLILSSFCSSLLGTCVTLLCTCGPLITVNRQRRPLSDIVSAQTKFRSEKVSSGRSASTRVMSLILNSLQSPVLA